MIEPHEPRVARAILRALLPEDEGEFILGDLAEDFREAVKRSGLTSARWWYRRQAMATLVDRLIRRPPPLETWTREVRFALRGLRRSPTYTVTTIGTLSVGIGGVVAIAALAIGVLRPLPLPDSGALYAVWETRGSDQRWVAPANYLDWRRATTVFAGLAAHDTRSVSITVSDMATRERVAVVSGNFFEVLRVPASLGRTFDPTFDAAFADHVAVLGHEAWIERFDGRPDVIGRTVLVDDLVYEVIGVMPADLSFPDAGLFAWLRSPTEAPDIGGFSGDLTQMRDAWYFRVIGRLADGQDAQAARAEMDALTSRLAEEYPDTNGESGVRLVPLLAQTVAGFGSTLTALALAVGLILLGATLNVLQLTLARAESRRHDVAVRVAIGAGRGALRRTALVEGWLIGLVSAALALVGARVAVVAGVARLQAVIPRASELTLTPGLGVAGLAMGLVAGTLIASMSYSSGGSRPSGALRSSRAFRTARDHVLVATQVSVAITVIATAGLLGRSLAGLSRVELGFATEGLSTLRVAIPDAPSRPYAERLALYSRVASAVRQLPSLSSVGIGANAPVSMGSRAGVFVEGDPATTNPPESGWQPVDPDYFEALGMTLVRGRGFDLTDGPSDREVAVVNEAFIRDVLDAREALGSRVTMGLDGHDRPLTIVGVVADTRTLGPAAGAGPVLYRPLAQTDRFGARSIFLAARGAPGSGTTVETIRRAIREVTPGLPVYDEAEGSDLSLPFRASQSMLLLVMSVFAATALLIGLVGVYGVGMHTVRRRRPEIGVRMALGATSGRITREVVGRGIRGAALGIVPGVALAITLGHAIESVLFGVTPTDPTTLAVVASLVLGLTAAVLVAPARLAASVDPARSTKEP